jgi:hypothetical protein
MRRQKPLGAQCHVLLPIHGAILEQIFNSRPGESRDPFVSGMDG